MVMSKVAVPPVLLSELADRVIEFQAASPEMVQFFMSELVAVGRGSRKAKSAPRAEITSTVLSAARVIFIDSMGVWVPWVTKYSYRFVPGAESSAETLGEIVTLGAVSAPLQGLT
jgi:hypothetical protein